MVKSKLLRAYKDYVTLKHYRPNTIKSYVKTIEKFLDFCRHHTNSELSVQDYAKHYLVMRFNTGKSWSSVNMDYSAILILCKHILKVGSQTNTASR